MTDSDRPSGDRYYGTWDGWSNPAWEYVEYTVKIRYHAMEEPPTEAVKEVCDELMYCEQVSGVDVKETRRIMQDWPDPLKLD